MDFDLKSNSGHTAHLIFMIILINGGMGLLTKNTLVEYI